MKCPICGAGATRTTRTVKLRHGKMEIKITYCHDIAECGFCILDNAWVKQEATR